MYGQCNLNLKFWQTVHSIFSNPLVYFQIGGNEKFAKVIEFLRRQIHQDTVVRMYFISSGLVEPSCLVYLLITSLLVTVSLREQCFFTEPRWVNNWFIQCKIQCSYYYVYASSSILHIVGKILHVLKKAFSYSSFLLVLKGSANVLCLQMQFILFV